MRFQTICFAFLVVSGCNVFSSSPSNNDGNNSGRDGGVDLSEMGREDVSTTDTNADMAIDQTMDMSSSDADADLGEETERWAQVTTGNSHVCALTTRGRLACWGEATFGKNGTNPPTATSRPTFVSNAANLVSIEAGGEFTCGLDAEGAPWCFGDAQLYPGNRQSIPTRVSGDQFQKLSAGDEHICGLTTEGEVSCWGINNRQQFPGSPSKVPVRLSIGQVDDMVVGGHTTCVLQGGTVRCFGAGVENSSSTDPDQSFEGFNFTELYSAGRAVCARNQTGVLCWGESRFTDDLTAGASVQPQPVPSITNGTVKVAAGRICVLNEGQIACGGNNSTEIIGNGTGTLTDESVAIQDVGLQQIESFDMGENVTCALDRDGVLSCWGRNEFGEVGIDVPGVVLAPQRTPLTNVVSVFAGDRTTCALDTSGTLRCVGFGGFGVLGQGTFRNDVNFQSIAGDWREVSLQSRHICGIQTNDRLFCWGFNGNAQLGIPGVNLAEPTMVDANIYDNVTAGDTGTCAVNSVGSMSCWGRGLGRTDGTFDTPQPMGALFSNIYRNTSGANHACGIDTANMIKCWGGGESGVLGDGLGQTERDDPVNAINIGRARKVEVGAGVSCGISDSDALYCWGFGYLNGTLNDSDEPVRISTEAILDLSVGADHSLATTRGGDILCWGLSWQGECQTIEREALTPVTIPIGDAVSVASGKNHSCYVNSVGELWCWGSQAYGVLGNGVDSIQRSPVALPLPQ